MGCKGSKQDIEYNTPKTGKHAITIDAKKPKSDTAELVVLGWSPIIVGDAFDTPYGKGVVEELRAALDDAEMTYAVLRLESGFVSVPEEMAREWKAKASAVKVGDAFMTPYGKGEVEDLKFGEDSGITYAVVRLSSGFVSVPEAVAGNWKAASNGTQDDAEALEKQGGENVLVMEAFTPTVEGAADPAAPLLPQPLEQDPAELKKADYEEEAVIQGDEDVYKLAKTNGLYCNPVPLCACEAK